MLHRKRSGTQAQGKFTREYPEGDRNAPSTQDYPGEIETASSPGVCRWLAGVSKGGALRRGESHLTEQASSAFTRVLLGLLFRHVFDGFFDEFIEEIVRHVRAVAFGVDGDGVSVLAVSELAPG